MTVAETTVNIGDDVTLTCTADNLPDPQFLWYKNGFQVSASDAEQISLTAVCILDFIISFLIDEYTTKLTRIAGSELKVACHVTVDFIFL